jgi:ABC-type sugar transport system ATPase subunit
VVEICRALVFDASILIFDEPTSSLSEAEAATVFRIVHNLRRQGRAVIYITHRMDELRRIGDRATVLRDGETVFTALLADITTDCLIEHMAGRAPQAAQPRAARPPGDELFRAENLTRPGSFENVSFTLHEGEVVGLAGLIGAGRTEICRAIFGFDSLASGSMTIQDRPYRPFGPRDAVRAGLALVPEDRQLHGLAASRPLNENMTLASLPGFSPGGILDRKAERGACATMMARLQIRANSTMQRAGELSGGNQQKAVLAKWLLAGARIFLLDEPTRGIDVAAKAEIASLIHDLAGEGAAILLVSSELSELLQLASRIVVLRNGRVAAELPGHTTQEEILRYATLD